MTYQRHTGPERGRCIILYALGLSPAMIGRLAAKSPNTVRQWVIDASFERDHPTGLALRTALQQHPAERRRLLDCGRRFLRGECDTNGVILAARTLAPTIFALIEPRLIERMEVPYAAAA